MPDRKKNEVRVNGYKNIGSPEQMKIKTLPTLPCGYLQWFSVAIVDRCILLIGGYDGRRITGESYALNTVKSCWGAYKMPSLNIPRYYHSALAIKNKVYVVSGRSNDRYFNSIEVLGVRVKGSG